MEEDKIPSGDSNKPLSLSQYFGPPTQNETVFDQISASTEMSTMSEVSSEIGSCELGQEAGEISKNVMLKDPQLISPNNFHGACNNSLAESVDVLCDVQPEATFPEFRESFNDSFKKEEPKLHEYFKNEDVLKSTDVFGLITSNVDINHDTKGIGFGDFCSKDKISAPLNKDSTLDVSPMEDPFTSSLYSSDFERRHDAWIPCEKTKLILLNMTNSPPGTYFPEKDLLTLPRVLLENELEDPVLTLCKKQFGVLATMKRQSITADSVTQDYRGVSELIRGGNFCAAINLTGRILAMYGQNIGNVSQSCKHSVHSLQLWFTRLALLNKMRHNVLAESESEPFRDFDSPDLYFEWSPELYGGKKGSLVPFGMRLLVAILPMYSGKHKVALDKLLKILRVVQEIQCNLNNGLGEDGHSIELSDVSRNESIKLWNKREIQTLQAVLNCVLAQRDYLLALELLETLMEKDSSNSANIYSAMERIHLQVGDLNMAEYSRQKAETLRNNSIQDIVANTLDRVFLDIAREDYGAACEKIDEALKIDPNNLVLINNKAVCLVYLGRLPEALTTYESAISNDPVKSMHEAFVCNLCTAYELGTSQLMEKKCRLLEHVSKCKGDGFLTAFLKFPL